MATDKYRGVFHVFLQANITGGFTL
jgi:hypothetical protein